MKRSKRINNDIYNFIQNIRDLGYVVSFVSKHDKNIKDEERYTIFIRKNELI
jgi:hypothetical protein